MSKQKWMGCLLGWAVVLGGCGEDAAPAGAVRPAKALAAKSPVAEAEVPAAAPGFVYAYNPIGKRDPFRSPADDLQQRPTENASCADPLCQWDVGQLTLVAVVTGDSNPMAMVQDPGGRGFIVRRHSKMGKQGGKVTQILRDSVIVTEYWTGPDGKVNPMPVTMRILPDGTLSPAMDLVTGKLFE